MSIVLLHNLLPVIGLVTAIGAAGLDPDLEPLRIALLENGADVEVVSWDDDEVEWAYFEAIILRSTWDYADRIVEFRAWLDVVDQQTRIVNPFSVVAWSIDKHYLNDLAREGVAVAPMTFVEVGDVVPSFDPAVEVFVVKPAVGAGSSGGRRCMPNEVADHVLMLHGMGHAAIVQPYLEMIDTHGETALVYLGNGGDLVYDHAFRKSAILRSTDVELEGGVLAKEEISDRTASDIERSLAETALSCQSVRALGPLAYARVDVVPTRNGPVLLELELVEPSLYFRSSAGSDVRAAQAWLRYIATTA
ncbi:RimK family alpha-L-glutamate ligase [uncultured Ilumatobacter sp.]|uniref:ATP-grasp domain-containing protein n=1 Tax=uncultured Ilumatobacter sp. TaxID=879968 RepID=UPI00374EBEDA